VTTGLPAGDGTDIGLPDERSGLARNGAEAPADERVRGLITRRPRLPSLAAARTGLVEEIRAQADRAMLWTPVAFGLGAAAYLGLKTEPPLWPLATAAAVLTVLAVATRQFSPRKGLRIVTALAAVAALGLLAGKLRTEAVAAPIVPPGLGVVAVEGFVVDVAHPSDHGERLLIAPVDIEHVDPDRLPHRVRLVVPEGDVLGPGSAVRVIALVDPPPGPATPGAFDFARDAWFSGLGGVGLAMAPPAAISLPAPPLRLRLVMAVNGLRWSLAQRLAADMTAIMGRGAQGGVGLAVTVATSHEDWLTDQQRNDLRGSGLAHMLAIAGLHTAAISGFVFFSLRLAIAAWPWLALRVPGKKIAALGGLIAVIAYLILSGAHPPARRAAITASVAFIAILLDRRAISLHSLSIAALLILVLQPEAVVEPGFEMSFCATASLVALAEIWPRAPRPIDAPWPITALQRLKDWTIAMLAVSVTAGAATGPFAIQHFNRIANYGVFANLTADLLASVALMPAMALSIIGEALGLAQSLFAPFLFVAGWAAKGVVSLAHLFANAPGAALALSSAPDPALAVAYLGIVFACLWRGRLRWIAAPLAAAVALWPRPAAPLAWIAADGSDAAVAVRGQEIALKPNERAYATQMWAQRRGLGLPADPVAAQAKSFDCDRMGCAPLPGTRPAIAAWWTVRKPAAGRLEGLCRNAQILILRAAVDPPPACGKALILTADDFRRGGSAEVFARASGWRLVWSQPLRGQRPWTAGQ
jgi:competence protein ComEC